MPVTSCGAAAKAAEPESAPRRVLVVDDERIVRELFRRFLLLAGFEVVIAAGGAEGLQRLAADHGIGLVILDLDMPSIDGRRFRSIQLGDHRLAHIPTVVVTGTQADPALREQLRASGYAHKPLDSRALVAVAERYCLPGTPVESVVAAERQLCLP